MAAAKMLQHPRAMYGISYLSWLLQAAEYRGCSQLILMSTLMGFTFEYMYLTRQPKVVKGHLTLTFDVAVQSFLKTGMPHETCCHEKQISTQLRVILDIRKE